MELCREENRKPLLENQLKTVQDEDVIDLMEIGYILWSHIVEIMICILLGAVACFGYTKVFVQKQYTATSGIYILSNADAIVDLSSLQISTQIKDDYQKLMTSRVVINDVIELLQLDMSYNQLKSMVSIYNPSDTRILEISATDTDPRRAADIANELARQSQIYLPEIMKIDSPSLYEEAIVPESPSSPDTAKNTLIGGLIGGVLYCGYLIVKHLMNDTFMTSAEIEKTFGIQPLSVIPDDRLIRSKKRKKGRK